MKIAVRNIEGKQVRALDVDDFVFGIQPNNDVLHQAYVTQRANQRSGSANTRTRGEVQGSTRKMRRQKYTGRARQGSVRAPHHVGGGVVFGPHQRSYAKDLPKKMRRLAIRSALSGKLADGQLIVVDRLSFGTPKTKEIIRVLRNVGINRSALVVTASTDRVVLASVRNLQKTKALPAAYLNVVDMMHHNSILMTEQAVRVAEQLWGRRAEADRAAPKPALSATEGPVLSPAEGTKPAARKRATKTAVAMKTASEAAAEQAPKRVRAARAKAEAPVATAVVAKAARAPAKGTKPARPRRAPKTPGPEATGATSKPRTRAKKRES